MKVDVDVDYVERQGDYGPIPSVAVTCSRCGWDTWAYGQSDDSIRRCCAELNEACPYGESNFYTTDAAPRAVVR